MADLGILNPNAAVVNTLNDWAVGTFADIDEPIASADGAAVGDDSNVNGNPTGRYALANVPTDLGTVDTIAANVRYRVIGAQTNTRGLFARIVTDESLPVSLTDEVTVNAAVSNTAFANSGALTFAIQGTPTKAQWDNAVIALRLNVAKSMAGDANGIRVDAVDITGTYTAAVAGDVLLVGTAAGSSTAEGVLSGEVPLVGAAAGSSTAQGLLSGEVPLAASAAGASTGLGNLTVTAAGGGDVLLAGTAVGSSTAQGVLSGEVPIAGAAAGSSTAEGNLTIEGTVNLTGTAAGTSTANGVLTGDVGLTGAATGSSTADGNLTVELLEVLLVGSAAGSSTADGILTALVPMVASAAGTSTATGQLSFATGRLRTEGRNVSGLGWEGTPSGIGLEGTRL